MKLTSIEKEKEKEKNNIRLKEILKTIKEWLQDLKNGTVEELEIKEQNSVVLHVKFESDDNLDKKMIQFQYFVVFLYDVDVFEISTHYYFDKSDSTGFKIMSREDKVSFANMLKIPLLTMNLGYLWIPDLIGFESLQISRPIYFDGFSKHNFMTTVDSVLHGYEIIASLYEEFRNSVAKRYQ